MAILRSTDGKFYDVPEDDLGNYEVPADQVKAMLGAANIGQSQGPMSGPGPGGGSGGSVRPYSYCGQFHNCFRNCFHNCGFQNHRCGSN